MTGCWVTTGVRLSIWVVAASLALVPPLCAGPLVQPRPYRMNVSSDGAQAYGHASRLSPVGTAVSANGRYVVFETAATLDDGDTNGVTDVFVRDRWTGTTTRVSVHSDGTQANGPSFQAVISADGRYVAFASSATNLVANDTNGKDDIFLRDLIQQQTMRVSIGVLGAQANGDSSLPVLNGDGSLVAFQSRATNLVSYDVNGHADVFWYDRYAGYVRRASILPDGTQGNGDSYEAAISGDGRYIAFTSQASNFATGDANGRDDVFRFEISTGAVELVSRTPSGTAGNNRSYTGSISWDGRYVAFESDATDLVSGDTNSARDIFLRDMRTGATVLDSRSAAGALGNGFSQRPRISANGRWVAFASAATNLVSDDTNGFVDVFLKDRLTNTVTRLSVDEDWFEGNGPSGQPHLSSDGRYYAFETTATDLVDGDTNSQQDILAGDGRGWVNRTLLAWQSSGAGGLFFYNQTTGGTSYLGTPTSAGYTYTALPPWSPNWIVSAGDANEDDITDLFLYNKSTGRWYDAVNDMPLGYTDFTYYTGTWSPGWDPYVLDLNGDGRSDVFVYNATTGAWYKCLRTGRGEFTYHAGSWSPGWELYPADLDADGRDDLFVYNRTSGLWYCCISELGGGFIYVGGRWDPGWTIVPADLNGDGKMDIFVYNQTVGTWFKCHSTGRGFTYAPPGLWSPGWTVVAAYFPGDRNADLFVYNVANGRWYMCLSTVAGFDYKAGSWSPGWQIYATDFDGTGWTCFVVYNVVTGVWWKCRTMPDYTFIYTLGTPTWSPGWTIISQSMPLQIRN